MSEAIEKELDALKSRGVIHPEKVVEWAQKHPASALHGEFEWDDSEAAVQYRIWQARRLIALHIVTETGERKTISLSIDRSNGGGYRDIEDVARAPDLRAVMLADALADLRRVQAKYRQLKELAGVFEEIERADKKHGRKKAA